MKMDIPNKYVKKVKAFIITLKQNEVWIAFRAKCKYYHKIGHSCVHTKHPDKFHCFPHCIPGQCPKRTKPNLEDIK